MGFPYMSNFRFKSGRAALSTSAKMTVLASAESIKVEADEYWLDMASVIDSCFASSKSKSLLSGPRL